MFEQVAEAPVRAQSWTDELYQRSMVQQEEIMAAMANDRRDHVLRDQRNEDTRCEFGFGERFFK